MAFGIEIVNSLNKQINTDRPTNQTNQHNRDNYDRIQHLPHSNAGFDKENRCTEKYREHKCLHKIVEILQANVWFDLIYHRFNRISHLLSFHAQAYAYIRADTHRHTHSHSHSHPLRSQNWWMMETMVSIKYLKITFIFIHRLNWINFHWLWFSRHRSSYQSSSGEFNKIWKTDEITIVNSRTVLHSNWNWNLIFDPFALSFQFNIM